MPSANSGGISFSAPAFLNQGQNPLSAINFAAPSILAQTPDSLSAQFFTPGNTINVIASVFYLQRVFSSGLGVWCYYTTTNAIDASPASAATTPNWTGSITGYELVTSYAA